MSPKLSDNKNGIIDTYNFKIELAGKKEHSVVEADVSMKGGTCNMVPL